MGFATPSGGIPAPSTPPDPTVIAAVKRRLDLIEQAIAILVQQPEAEPAPMLGQPVVDHAVRGSMRRLSVARDEATFDRAGFERRCREQAIQSTRAIRAITATWNRAIAQGKK